MDGTLTHAIHDFDEIRQQLGLPSGQPILESIAQLPTTQAAAVNKKLDDLEFEIASRATAQPHSKELLELLKAHGHAIGIVTRNGHGIALATLKACGLDEFFTDEFVISRDCCEPKPSPAGVNLLLSRWSAPASSAVIVGDYLFDLEAGKNAGIATVHLDVNGEFLWPDYTDHKVTSLEPLAALFSN